MPIIDKNELKQIAINKKNYELKEGDLIYMATNGVKMKQWNEVLAKKFKTTRIICSKKEMDKCNVGVNWQPSWEHLYNSREDKNIVDLPHSTCYFEVREKLQLNNSSYITDFKIKNEIERKYYISNNVKIFDKDYNMLKSNFTNISRELLERLINELVEEVATKDDELLDTFIAIISGGDEDAYNLWIASNINVKWHHRKAEMLNLYYSNTIKYGSKGRRWLWKLLITIPDLAGIVTHPTTIIKDLSLDHFVKINKKLAKHGFDLLTVLKTYL